MQILPSTVSFSDVDPETAEYQAIVWSAQHGIIPGREDGTFRPQGTVGRRAMATFLYRLAGKPEVTPPRNEPFGDVEKGDAGYRAIIWAQREGIVRGYGDGTFRPAQKVTREEAAVMLYRYAGSPAYPSPTKPPYPDVEPGARNATEIAWLKARGIATTWEDGTFRPTVALTRASAASFLYRTDAVQHVAFREG
nr:S-layer homology domain-containing protein [Brachybacterium endophyticum]